MKVSKIALGVVQQRGAVVVDPDVVTFGPAEEDFLVRHVERVRGMTSASARSAFAPSAGTPAILGRLKSTSVDADFESAARALQGALAQEMKTSTNARDCVFAVVRAGETASANEHITILKLDAVVEAARMEFLKTGGVTFKVLKDLLPEPGKLQKALSWPDPRTVSDVIMLDTNETSAHYFENAYQVRVSPKSTEAEGQLVKTLVERIPQAQVPAAITAAAALSGPLDVVLDELAGVYPELAGAATTATADGRPAGIVRTNKANARPVVWRADGAELRIPAELIPYVRVEPSDDGWIFTLRTLSEPQRGV